MAKKSLSHEEVWDDSVLVSSWNEALEEYKKYHSLAAKGEKIEVILDKAEKSLPEDSVADAAAVVESNTHDAVAASGHANKEPNTANKVPTSVDAIPTEMSTTAAQGATTFAPVPQALLHSVQDEGLKNIMMSWYYAGYYTGLYEGQQKAATTVPQ